MDPNATLARLRELLGGDHSGRHDYRVRLSVFCELEELWQALDEWLSKGGFFPDDWGINRPIYKGPTPT